MRPQVIIGMPSEARFLQMYPDTDFEKLWKLAVGWRVFFEGHSAKSMYGPQMTGSGLNFSRCDEFVPWLIEHSNPEDILPFPVPLDEANERLKPTYEYFKAKGWLNARRWFVYFSDEPRHHNLVDYQNEQYHAFVSAYPELLWMVTDHAASLPHRPGRILGDIICPMMVFHEFEREADNRGMLEFPLRKYYQGSTDLGREVRFAEYTSGSMPGYGDVNPLPLEPAAYRVYLPNGKDVPNPAQNPHRILPFVKTNEFDMCRATAGWTMWYFWNGMQFTRPHPSNPETPGIIPEFMSILTMRPMPDDGQVNHPMAIIDPVEMSRAIDDNRLLIETPDGSTERPLDEA